MTRLTITEALSEINLLKKKLESARNEMRTNLIRAKHMPDTFAAEGGLLKHNEAVMQSITDMGLRLVSIRSAIARANLANTITIGSATRSIHDWLTWRREVMEADAKCISDILARLRTHNDTASRQPQVYKDAEGTVHLIEYELGLDIPALLKQVDAFTEVREKLDGQLSLKNATIVIDF